MRSPLISGDQRAHVRRRAAIARRRADGDARSSCSLIRAIIAAARVPAPSTSSTRIADRARGARGAR